MTNCIFRLKKFNSKNPKTIKHVIPQAFYKEYRKNKQLGEDFYIKIPMCEKCNNEKSILDDELKTLLVLESAHLSNSSKTLFKGKVIPFFNNYMRYKGNEHQMISDTNVKPIYLPSGELRYEFKYPLININKYFTFIIKGLIFHELRCVLIPNSYEILFDKVDRFNQKKLDVDEKSLGNKIRRKKDPIFRYIFETKNNEYNIIYYYPFLNI